MAELTINTDDITAALRKGLDGLKSTTPGAETQHPSLRTCELQRCLQLIKAIAN